MLSERMVVRHAQAADGDALEALQRLALRRLALTHYSGADIEAGLDFVGTLDPELIEDGTYYVAEIDGRIVGCGGWSFRARILGDDPAIQRNPSDALAPDVDAARIRAVFVHPSWTRRGIARGLVGTAEAAAQLAGFRRFALVSTLNAEALCRTLGYQPVGNVFLDLPNKVRLKAVRMTKGPRRRPAGDGASRNPSLVGYGPAREATSGAMA